MQVLSHNIIQYILYYADQENVVLPVKNYFFFASPYQNKKTMGVLTDPNRNLCEYGSD